MIALITLICFFGAGCGYHTAGHAVTLPDNVRTIAIPAFVNQTQTFKIEQMLTAAVVRELVTRTHYRVIDQVMTMPMRRCMGLCFPHTPHL